MNRRYFSGSRPLLFALAASLPSLLTASSASAQEKPTPHVAGQFLVRWASQKAPLVLAPKVNPAPWQQQSLRSQVSSAVGEAKVQQTFEGSGWSLISVPAGTSDEATRAELAARLGAANVSYNYIRHVARTPDKDPLYSQQWHLPKIKAPEAWNVTTGDSKVVVAVLDTGVDLKHPDLVKNLWKNPGEVSGNGKDDDKNGYIDDVYGLNAIDPSLPPQDDDGHGTHCAGIIGAVGNNSIDVAGVSWNVKIISLKFLNERGEGPDADAIKCIEYAVKLKKKGVNLRVISNSWTGPLDNPPLKEAFRLAESNGILNVCAAGNDEPGHNIDLEPAYPAAYSFNSIITVAASNANDELAGFSNYGTKQVDLAAPGTAILSLKLGGGTVAMEGTSMATPLVAGAAALIASREPGLTYKDIKARILNTADRIPALKGKVLTGARLNLYRAVANATLSISGQVYRLNGTTKVPLAGALIKLNNKALTSSDKNGKYVVNDLPPATYAMTATLKGYGFNAASVAMPRPSGTPGAPNGVVDFPATTVPSALYSLSGYALGPDGAPHKNVSIFLSGSPVPIATTGTNGKYTINDRAAGTYKLTATSPNVLWTPSASSIALPVKSTIKGAPNGTVDFAGSAPDTQAPTIAVASPSNGSTIAPGSPTAQGTMTDQSGVVQLNFQLSRQIGFDYSVYNWITGQWGSDSEGGVIATQTTDRTSTTWSRSLPNLIPGTYTLTVNGRDAVGNESTNTASKFTVASSTTSSKSSAVTSSSAPSGGRS